MLFPRNKHNYFLCLYPLGVNQQERDGNTPSCFILQKPSLHGSRMKNIGRAREGDMLLSPRVSPSLARPALFRALYIFIAPTLQANRNWVNKQLTARSASLSCVFWGLRESVLLRSNVKRNLSVSQNLAIISLLVNRATDVRHCFVLFFFFLALVVASCDIDPQIKPSSMPHWFTLFIFQVSDLTVPHPKIRGTL